MAKQRAIYTKTETGWDVTLPNGRTVHLALPHTSKRQALASALLANLDRQNDDAKNYYRCQSCYYSARNVDLTPDQRERCPKCGGEDWQEYNAFGMGI